MGCILDFLIGLLLVVAMTLGTSFSAVLSAMPSFSALPCFVITADENVPVRVGPGENRAVRLFLPVSEPVAIVGQTTVDGAGWWQLEMADVEQGWVAQADVEAAGECDGVPEVEAPPLVAPAQAAPEPPSDGWGVCGSCDTCLGPAAECVTNPDGQCVWDATRCGGTGGSGEPGSQEPPPPQGTEEVVPPPPVSTPELVG